MAEPPESDRLLQQLQEHIPVIYARWKRALHPTGFTQDSPATVEKKLLGLIEEAIALLSRRAFIPEQAHDLGQAVVGLGYTAPEALRATLQTFGREFSEALAPEQLLLLHPRLLAFLRELAVGFTVAQRELILASQEQQQQSQLAVLHQIKCALDTRQFLLETITQTSDLAVMLFAASGMLQLSVGTQLESLSMVSASTGVSVNELFAEYPEVVHGVQQALAGSSGNTTLATNDQILELHFLPLPAAVQPVSGALCLAGEVTASQQARDRLALVLHTLPMILFTINDQGVITFSAGRGLASLAQATAASHVGQSVFDRYLQYPAIIAAVRQALTGATFSTTVLIEDKAFEVHFTPVSDATETPAGIIGIALDITARFQAERLLRRRAFRFSHAEERLLPLLARSDLPTYRQIGTLLGYNPARVRDLVKSIAGLNLRSRVIVPVL